MTKLTRSLVALLLALAVGVALAHAHLATSEPAHGSVVDAGLESVSLAFTEQIETAFSAFKVFRLEEAVAALGMPAQDNGEAAEHEHAKGDDHDHSEGAEHDHAEGAEHDHGHAEAALDPTVQAQAEAVMTAALADPGFDTGLVESSVEPRSGAHPEIELALAEALSPGTYVVVFRALSVDTHAADGYLVFTVAE